MNNNCDTERYALKEPWLEITKYHKLFLRRHSPAVYETAVRDER